MLVFPNYGKTYASTIDKGLPRHDNPAKTLIQASRSCCWSGHQNHNRDLRKLQGRLHDRAESTDPTKTGTVPTVFAKKPSPMTIGAYGPDTERIKLHCFFAKTIGTVPVFVGSVPFLLCRVNAPSNCMFFAVQGRRNFDKQIDKCLRCKTIFSSPVFIWLSQRIWRSFNSM